MTYTSTRVNQAPTPLPQRFFSFLTFFVPLFLLPLLVVPGLIDVGLTPRFIGLGLFLVVLGGVLLERSAAPRKEGQPDSLHGSTPFQDSFLRLLRQPLFLIYAAYLGWITIRLVFSPNKSEALFDWQRTALLFFFMVGISIFLGDRPSSRPSSSFLPYGRLVKLISVFSLVLVTLGGLQLALLLSAGELSHELTYHIRGTFGHRNLFSQLLFLTLPFSLTGLWLLKKGWRMVCLAAVTLTVSAITFLLARSVWVALAGATMATLILALIFRKSLAPGDAESQPKWPRFAVLGLIVGVMGLTAVLYTKADKVETLVKTGREMQNMQYGSPKERILMWKASVEMFKKQPVWGTGLASWKTEFPAYGLTGLRPEAERGEHHFQRPHNDFFWVLTETGIIGLLLWLGIFGAALWGLVQTLRTHPDREARIFALLLIFGIVGYLGFSFFSFPKERIEHGIYLHLMLACGVVLRQVGEVRVQGSRSPRQVGGAFLGKWGVVLGWVAMMGVGVMCMYTGWFRMAGEYFTHRTLEARAEKDLHRTTFEADAALSPFYKMDPSATPLYWYKGEAFFLMGDYPKAKATFEDSKKLHPNHIHVLNNLGSTLVQLDETEAAKEQYRRALEISPNFEEARYNLSAVQFRENPDSSWNALSKVAPQYGDPRYLRSVDLITHALTWRLAAEAPNETLKELLLRIHYDPEWRKNLHKKAIMDGLDYKTQVILDAIYVLETVDETITFEEAEKLRTHYQLITEKNP